MDISWFCHAQAKISCHWMALKLRVLLCVPSNSFFFTFFVQHLTLCILETPKWVLWLIVKSQMKCSIMLHYIRVCTVSLDLNNLQGQKYIIIQSPLILNSIITPFEAFEIYHVFENIMENGAFALLEQNASFP